MSSTSPTSTTTEAPPLSQKQKSLLSKLERYENRGLCSRCRTILRRGAKVLNQRGWNEEVVATRNGLPDATISRCVLCLLFLSTLSGRRQEEKVNGSHNDLGHLGTFKDIQIEYFVHWKYIGFQNVGENELRNGLELHDPKEECFRGPPTEASHLDVSTDSPASLSFAKQQLATCDRYHKFCFKQELIDRVLPTRLIDIGTSTFIQPHLVSSKQLDENSKYLTLSHCWGGHVPFQLLESNIETMKHSIPFNKLPQTFRDAMHFTKNLGLRYLWIDSLCIIQNSREDWQKESAQMCHVYANSYCNIAAGAKNSSIGLFTSRDPRLLQPITVCMGGMKHRVVNHYIWRQLVEDVPLNQRSWVLQERILSPRNLHFSKEILWECYEKTASESFPGGYPPTMSHLVSFKRKAKEGLKPPPDFRNRSWPHYIEHESWKHIVKKYSNLSLTFESDKLIAIGGLAQKLQSVLDDTYLAGIWEHQLATQLLWSCKDSYSKPKEYIAPSWSWASVNSGVLFPHLHLAAKYEPLISLKSTKIEYETSNTFGQVKSGALYLCGNLFRITSVCNDVGLLNRSFIWAECLIDAGLDCDLDAQFPGGSKKNDQTKQKYMYGLSLLFCQRDEIPGIFGLLLESSGNAGQFQRVGMFSVSGECNLELVKIGMQCFDDKVGGSDLEYIDDGEGGHKYLITLI